MNNILSDGAITYTTTPKGSISDVAPHDGQICTDRDIEVFPKGQPPLAPEL